MTDQLQTLQDDITFLKSLALEGRSPAILGGSALVAAGAVYGAASVGHWAIVTGVVPVTTPWAFPVLWSAATVVFLCVMVVLERRLGETRPVGAASRASAAPWQGVGWTIFTLAACLAIVSWQAHSTVPLRLFPSIILALYGMAWSVTASVTTLRWTGLAAAGAYLAAVLAAAISASSAVYLLFAAALVLLAIVPGVALIRRARAVV